MPAITPPSLTPTGDGAALRALSAYVHQIAGGLGVGPESTWCELGDQANAYIALDHRPPGRTQEFALLWDERSGWAAAVETTSGEDMLVIAYFGSERLPAPAEVVAFARRVLAGDHAGQPEPPEPGHLDLVHRLLARTDTTVDLS